MHRNRTVKFSSSIAREEKRELKREKQALKAHRLGLLLLRDRDCALLHDPYAPLEDRILVGRMSPQRAETLERHGGEIAISEVDVLPC